MHLAIADTWAEFEDLTVLSEYDRISLDGQSKQDIAESFRINITDFGGDAPSKADLFDIYEGPFSIEGIAGGEGYFVNIVALRMHLTTESGAKTFRKIAELEFDTSQQFNLDDDADQTFIYNLIDFDPVSQIVPLDIS